MLPEGWTKSTVGKSCAIKNNLRYPISASDRRGQQGPYPYFGPTGRLDTLDHYRIDEAFALIGEDGDHFLKYQEREMTLFYEGRANVNNHAHVIADSADCLAKWFFYCFMHRDLTSVLSRQGVGRYKLTKAGLESLEILVPPIEEQRCITRLLDVWGSSITATEKLLANSRRQKQDLMQGLLTGHRAFSVDSTEWLHLDLDQIFERVTRKNIAGDQNVLTISGQHGLISQREYFSRVVASDDLSGYTHLSTGDFAYNKSSSNGYPMGAIKPLVAYDSGVVSSLYICFRIRAGVEADEDFFSHYFDAGMLNDEITGIAQEGARNHGLLNVSVKEFFKLKLRVPPLEDQRRIAEVLNTAQEEIRNIERQLERLKTEKRALMNDLLTGKRRVRIPAHSEEAREPA